MRTKNHLRAGHFTNLIPAWSGVWALIWKDCVQALRGFNIRSIISGLVLFSLGFGMLIAFDWGTRFWVFFVWGLLIGQVCSKRFSSDLKLWVVFRLLPFSFNKTLVVEIASSVLGAIGLCWFAYGVCSFIGLHPSLPVAVLAPGIILCITLAAVFDILRQSKTDALLSGHVNEMGVVGLLFGLILAGLPLALVIWISNQMSTGFILWITSLLGLFLSLGIAYGIWLMAVYQYRNIK
jgi:hypothetical protein